MTKILNLTAITILSLYLLILCHIQFPTSKLLLEGLANPQNLLFILVSVLFIALGFLNIASLKRIVLNNKIKSFFVATLIISTPNLINYILEESYVISTPIIFFIGALMFMMMYQLCEENNTSKYLIYAFILSGIMQASITSAYSDIQILTSNNHHTINTNSALNLFLTVCTVFSLYNLTNSKENHFLNYLLTLTISILSLQACYKASTAFPSILIAISYCLVIFKYVKEYEHKYSKLLKALLVIVGLVSIGTACLKLYYSNFSFFNFSSLSLLKDKYILGYGADTYQFKVIEYNALNNESLIATNSFFVKSLIENGIIQFLGYLIIYFGIIYHVIKNDFDTLKKICCLVVTNIIFIYNLLDNTIDYSYSTIFLFIFSLFLFTKNTSDVNTIKKQDKGFNIIFAFILTVLTTLFVITGLYSLPIIEKEIQSNDFNLHKTELASPYLYNTFVRLNDYTVAQGTSSSQNFLNMGISLLALEPWENLKYQARYNHTYSFFKDYNEITKRLNQSQTNKKIHNFDFESEYKYSMKLYKYLENKEKNDK